MLIRRLVVCLSIGASCALSACASVGSQQPNALSPDAQLQVAEAADAAGNGELAISMYSAAAAREPDNIELQLRCADALARGGKISEARQLLEQRLRAHPGQTDLTRALALIDLVSGQPASAIARLDQLLAANPGDLRALVDKAVALDLRGQHAAAQAIYQQVLARAPNDAAAKNDFALSLMLEGRTRQALQMLAPMQDEQDSPQRLKDNLGILYAATGNMDRSQQLLGGRVSSADLMALTRVLSSSGAEGTIGQTR